MKEHQRGSSKSLEQGELHGTQREHPLRRSRTCEFRVDGQGSPATGTQGQGFTRDISSKGMFIYSDSEPPARANLQVEVSFRSVVEAITNLELQRRW